MTRQEIFDTAYIGVLKQGRQSLMPSGACAYRGSNGLKCALGFMIDDDTAEKWESIGAVDSLINRHNDGRITLPTWVVQYKNLLMSIQEAHDRATDPEGFVEYFSAEMQYIASQYKLTIPQLETTE